MWGRRFHTNKHRPAEIIMTMYWLARNACDAEAMIAEASESKLRLALACGTESSDAARSVYRSTTNALHLRCFGNMLLVEFLK